MWTAAACPISSISASRMNCSTIEAFDQFRSWREADLLVRVSFVDASSDAVPRTGIKILGSLVEIAESALVIRWSDGEILLNLGEAVFLYAEPPAEFESPLPLVACLQADWSDGSRALFLARRRR